MDYVRVSPGLRDIRASIDQYLAKQLGAISKNNALKNEIARIYGEVVTPYVPRSDRGPGHHHLQTFYVSDGRVMWTRHLTHDAPSLGLSAGDEIANLLYEGPLFPNQQFRSRYAGHDPQPHWDEMVRRGTPDWDEFISRVEPVLIEYVVSKNG